MEILEMNNEELLALFNALSEKVDALYDLVVKQIVEPTIEKYNTEQKDAFMGKYGEKLEPYGELMKTATGTEDYNFPEEVYNEYKTDDRGMSEDEFVDAVVVEADKYVQKVKEALGVPGDAAVVISDDGQGDVEVVADTDGDGEVDTNVTEESKAEVVEEKAEEPAPTEETPDEEAPTEEPSEEDEMKKMEEEYAKYLEEEDK